MIVTLTITEISNDKDNALVNLYTRRIELDDINRLIRGLDTAIGESLSYKPRKVRSDCGKKRGEQ